MALEGSCFLEQVLQFSSSGCLKTFVFLIMSVLWEEQVVKGYFSELVIMLIIFMLQIEKITHFW